MRGEFKNESQSIGQEEVDGKVCDLVYITGDFKDHIILYLDNSTGLPFIKQNPAKAPMTGAPVTQKIVMTEYKEIDGLKIHTVMTIKHDDEVFATGNTEAFELNPEIDEALFTK